jgi:hypothetical protein
MHFSRYTSSAAVRLAIVAAFVLLVFTSFTSVTSAHAQRAHRRRAKEALATNLRLFAQSSVWNTQVPGDASIDPNSRNVVGSLVAQLHPVAGMEAINNLYIAGAHTHRVRVNFDGNGGPTMQAAFESVPIPSYAHPMHDSDAQMAIYQPSTDTMWEFWRLSKQANGWHAVWGGRMEHVSTDPGYYRNVVTPSGNVLEKEDWGAPATSFPLMAGVIMISELESGVIPHALAFAVKNTCAGIFVAPAQRTDGNLNPATNPNCVPEGAHFRLDPHLNIAALHLPPLIQMMAVAAQKYGMIVVNRTEGVGIYDQDPSPYEADWGFNPYFGRANQPGTPGALYNGWPTLEILQFPWSHLQLLNMNLRTKPNMTRFVERATREG